MALGVALTGLFEKDRLPAGHDVWPHAVSAFEYARAIEQGVAWPRWLPDLCGGYGAPNPLYYSPLAHQVTGRLVLAGLTVPEALRAAAALAMALSAWGMYVWTRRSWGRAAAVLASTLYLLAPYHLVDLYLRFSYPELIGLALAPWLFARAQVAVEEGRGERGVAVLLAVIALAHNLSAFLFGGFLVVWLGALALDPARRAGALRVLASLPLAAGLAAFFWMPALLDAHLVRLSYEPSVRLTWRDHLHPPHRLLESQWPGKREYLPLYPGRLHLGLGCAGLVAAAVLAARGDPRARAWTACAAASVAVLALTQEVSRPLWAASPLKVVQFPWRFLGVAALGLAWAAPLALWPLRARPRLHALACALVTFVVMVDAFPRCRPDGWRELHVNRSVLRSSWQTADLDNQFVPITALYPTAFDRPLLELIDGHAIGKVLESGPERHRISMNAASDALLDVHLMMFDGWRATIDGQPVPLELEPAFGGMRVRIPKGQHELAIEFGGTPLRDAALLVSAATLFLMVWPWHGRVLGWAVLVYASILVVVPVARRALPFGPDHHAHRARLALARRDHYAALAELDRVDPDGPHGAWAASQRTWHRDHGLAAQYYADEAATKPLVARTEYGLAYHSDMTPGQPFELGARAAVLTARLDVPADGAYDFSVDTGMRVSLRVDGLPVVRELRKNQGWRADGAIDLTKGPHALRLEIRPGFGYMHYRIWWRKRPGAWELLPVDRLTPDGKR